VEETLVLEFEKENSETISLIKNLMQMQIFSTATYNAQLIVVKYIVIFEMLNANNKLWKYWNAELSIG